MHRGYGGYVVEGGGQSVYHSGDTAYFEGFREIGRRLQPEVALLPIGLVGLTWAALRERYYSAVMAATGLLYLAILTAFGTDLIARATLVP